MFLQDQMFNVASSLDMQLRKHCKEIGWNLKVRLRVDSSGARSSLTRPGMGRMKHVDRRHFYIRDMVESLTIEVPYVPTDENIADFFTKALPAKKFFPMRDRIMGVPGVAQYGTIMVVSMGIQGYTLNKLGGFA